MLLNLLYVFILLLAFPTGYLLTWLARDELISGKKWFLALAVISVLAVLPVNLYVVDKLPSILTLLFIAIISLVAVWKSHDKNWTKMKNG